MISAKLIKNLEKIGFNLDFPGYNSIEEEIIDILKEKNQRLYLAIPMLLQKPFDYYIIKKKIDNSKDFDKIILIANDIFGLEKVGNSHLLKIIKENKISGQIKKEEIKYYYGAFKEFFDKKKKQDIEILEAQIEKRGKLDTNKALSAIYSPGKIRIMEKIFAHEPLTNTELKYYYRSIRPIDKAISNDSLRKYIQLIESAKKISEKE